MLLAILVHYAANMWIEKTKSPTRCYLDKTPSSPCLLIQKKIHVRWKGEATSALQYFAIFQ